MITETQTALVVKRYEDPEDKSLPWSKKFTFRGTNGMLFTSVEYTFEKVATVKVNDLVRVVWWEAPSSQRDRGRGPYETVHMSVASMGTEGIVLNASDDKQLVVHRSREKWTVVHASYQTPIRGTVWLCKPDFTHISIHNGMMHFNTSQIANGFCGYTTRTNKRKGLTILHPPFLKRPKHNTGQWEVNDVITDLSALLEERESAYETSMTLLTHQPISSMYKDAIELCTFERQFDIRYHDAHEHDPLQLTHQVRAAVGSAVALMDASKQICAWVDKAKEDHDYIYADPDHEEIAIQNALDELYEQAYAYLVEEKWLAVATLLME